MPEGAVEEALASPRVHVLCMHHVFADEREEFSRLLDRLASTHDLLTVSDACDRLEAGPVTRPIACITFDDGFLHHLEVGDAVRSRGGHATFFPCTEPLDASESERDAFCIRALRRPPIAMMGWSHLERLRGQGHEIGCHTASHRPLSDVPLDRLVDEIHAPAALLRARVGPVRCFAWPFGRWMHLPEAAQRAIAEAGFERALSTYGGCHRSPPGHVASACMARDAVEPMIGCDLIRRVMARSANSSTPLVRS